MGKKEISVIVPAYNCEGTIEKCLDSILKQTISEKIEIVVVNDGSTDGTAKILDKYREEYPCSVKVLTQVNSGPAEARNTGIKDADGAYIGFVDSDDYIEPDMYELMLDRMSEDTDLVMCGRFNAYASGKVKVKKNPKTYDGTSLENNPGLLCKISTFVCDKLFKKNLIFRNEIFFSMEYRYAEDFHFLQRYVLKCGKVGVVRKPLYHYNLGNPNSITSSAGRKWLDICKVLSSINEICIDEGCFDLYKDSLLYSSAAFYCRRIRTFKDYNNTVIEIQFVRSFMRYFDKYFPGDWKQVVYNHRIDTARNSRTNFLSMIGYIIKLRLRKISKFIQCYKK